MVIQESLVIRGIPLAVRFEFVPGQIETENHPGTPDWYEIQQVTISGVEVTPVLTDDIFREIEDALRRRKDEAVLQILNDRALAVIQDVCF